MDEMQNESGTGLGEFSGIWALENIRKLQKTRIPIILCNAIFLNVFVV